jgi:superfamily II DNA helicase RecQ
VRRFRQPSLLERFWLDRILAELRRYDGLATGTLYRTLCPKADLDRRVFERYVDAMARCGVVRAVDDAFDADGRTVTYRRLFRNAEGIDADAVTLEGDPEEARRPAPTMRRRKPQPVPEVDGERPDPEVVARLKRWRLEVAREERVPAFRVLTDRALRAIAAARPRTLGELLRVGGVGPRVADRFGEDILRALAG